jgi:hypothetical protein
MIEATQRKLREADFFLQRLIDERRRSVRNEPEAFLFYLSAFLSAARSVTLVLQKEEKQRYDAWFPKWFARRSKDERDVCNFMRDQRNVELHETGADVNLSSVSIPYIEIAAGEFGDPLYSFNHLAATGSTPLTSSAPRIILDCSVRKRR